MKRFVRELKVGEQFQSPFFLKRKELLKTKEGKPYLRLVVSDRTGSIEAKVWEDAERADENVETGCPVIISGVVDSWKEKRQLRVEEIRLAKPEEYKQEDLIRIVENTEELFGKVKDFLGKITDKWLSLLAKKFLEDPELIERFKTSLGAQNWHNAYVGGLLEHTYETMYICERMCDLYREANRDLVMFGAFAHDIGKILELSPETFEYTVDGGLIGHLTLGYEIVAEKINQVPGFPKETALKLKHIILSHHGEYEQQSPILPKTLEATIVYHADELVSQANAVKELIESESDGDKAWSSYVTIKNRKYLLKKGTFPKGTP